MKPIFFSISFLFSTHNFTQAQIDATSISVKAGMVEAYNNAFDSLHPYLQKVIIMWDSLDQVSEGSKYIQKHFVYVTNIHTDTLNIDSITLPDLSDIKIIAIDGIPYEEKPDTEYEIWKNMHQEFWVYWTDIVDDTLIVKMSGMMDWWDVEFKIFDQLILASYNEGLKYDTVFKLNLQDDYSLSLTLPVTLNKIYMNQSIFKAGDELIGFASCTVNPYYIRNYDDPQHPFHVQHSFDLYFRVLAQEVSK